MQDGTKQRCGMAEILLMVGFGIKMFHHERGIAGCGIVIKLTVGYGMKIRKMLRKKLPL